MTANPPIKKALQPKAKNPFQAIKKWWASCKSRAGRGVIWAVMDDITRWSFALVVLPILLFMIILLAMGAWELILAAWTFEWIPESSVHATIGGHGSAEEVACQSAQQIREIAKCAPSSVDKGIRKIIHALEFFILAPLPYVVLEGLATYLSQRVDPDRAVRNRAVSVFTGVKALVASILVSIVTVNLVGKVLYREPLTWETAGVQLLIIVVLSAYFVLMEKLSREGEALHLAVRESSTGDT